RYQQQGIEWLQNAIQQEDPEFYKQGEIQNPVRMIRALSFIRSTSKSILNYRTGTKAARPFNIIKIALDLPREVLYRRINRRVDIMMEQGLLEEVKQLYTQRHLKNLQTVGYSELFDYIDGKYTLEEAVDKIKQHTRNYAKRQLTWFRKDKEFYWLEADAPNVTDRILALK
ncbi:MAG TPA: tRNA dimethylallyltransferase, partial [Flavipsychrobacter sp.]